MRAPTKPGLYWWRWLVNDDGDFSDWTVVSLNSKGRVEQFASYTTYSPDDMHGEWGGWAGDGPWGPLGEAGPK